MPQLEMQLIQMKGYIMVEYSLMSRIIKILTIFCESYTDNPYFTYLDDLRKTISTKTNSDLYITENRNIVKDIYNFLKNKKEWEEDFIFNYNIFYDLNEITGGKILLGEIEDVLKEIDYIVVKLSEIIRLDYQKMKKDNMPFSEDLAKYVSKKK